MNFSESFFVYGIDISITSDLLNDQDTFFRQIAMQSIFLKMLSNGFFLKSSVMSSARQSQLFPTFIQILTSPRFTYRRLEILQCFVGERT